MSILCLIKLASIALES